jgi:hypothetical protein
MIHEIKSKWVISYKDWNLIITPNRKVIDIKTKVELVEYWNNGVISYRIPRTAKRIGVKTMNKYCVKKEITIQEYIPF